MYGYFLQTLGLQCGNWVYEWTIGYKMQYAICWWIGWKMESFSYHSITLLGCFILPLFQNFHSLRWESLTIHTRSTLIFFGRFWGPPSSPIRPGSYFRPGPPDFWPQNHINDHKTPLNCQKDSSNTSRSMFFGVGNWIMTLLEQMGHQIYVNFQIWVIF